jgi:hypothetical protein
MKTFPNEWCYRFTKIFCMNDQSQKNLDLDLVLDCSQEKEVSYWAQHFNVSPQAIKTAVRACCNNNIISIARYLQSDYKKAKRYMQGNRGLPN